MQAGKAYGSSDVLQGNETRSPDLAALQLALVPEEGDPVAWAPGKAFIAWQEVEASASQ